MTNISNLLWSAIFGIGSLALFYISIKGETKVEGMENAYRPYSKTERAKLLIMGIFSLMFAAYFFSSI